MSDVFGEVYAHAYDAIYRDKDYPREARLLDAVFREHAARRVSSVLDLGCGTGAHALCLAELGYTVTGVDRSPAMAAQATSKFARSAYASKLRCHQGDLTALDLHEQFDAVTMMFAVLGYQISNADVIAALRSARQHLRSTGVFVCDVWFGPAVLKHRPSDRAKQLLVDATLMTRTATSTMDLLTQTCVVAYELTGAAAPYASLARELHRMRFFFPAELSLLLEDSGFRLLRLLALPDAAREPTEDTWNVLVIARPT